MDIDLKIIKKKYGEKMMHLCRELFPTLLETPGKLSELMLKLFYPSRNLYEDIINNHLEFQFKDYIYSNIEPSEEELIQTQKTPKELLSKVGYDFYECQTEEQLQSFKKYYKIDEELCSFRDNRTKTNYVFFAVKKNVDEIKRENFKHPYREDEYGTSVISIQFSKGEINTLSIKNRYNHTVKHPDSTFYNNLENIIPGLTESFERVYNLNLVNHKNNFYIPGHIKANDGKFYKYNCECYNTYYCEDNIIVKNGEIITKYLDKEKYLIIDYFVLDLVNKKIYIHDERINDSFTDGIKDIEKITIIKSKENSNKTIGIICKNNKIIIEIDKYNKIIGYENDNLKEIGDNFLSYNTSLTYINLPSLKKVGDWFLIRSTSLERMCLPSLEEVGNYFIAYNWLIKEIYLPKLKKAGDNFLKSNTSLIKLNLPKIKELGDCALSNNNSLKEIILPKLVKAGTEFLMNNNSLEKLYLENLEELGNYALTNNCSLKTINLPRLRKTGLYFLNKKNSNLISVNLPSYSKNHDFIKLADSNRNKIIKEETIQTMPTKKEKRLYKRFIERMHSK